MKRNGRGETDPVELRRRAEELEARADRQDGVPTHDDALALVHELRVHQIELELQKEDLELQKDELAAARTEAEALRDRYADLYDFAPVGYATLDTQGIVREANLTGSLLLGTPRQTLIGCPFLFYVHPESQPLYTAFAHRVRSSGEPGTIELAMRAPDGRAWHAAVTARLEPTGSTGWLRLAIGDVTESRRDREAAAESEEQFRRAIEDAPIPIIMHAEDGQVLKLSRTWTELTGYGPEDMPTFDAWLNRAYGEGADDVRDHVRSLFRGTSQTIEIEFPIRTRDGRTRYWSFSASSPGTLADGRRYAVGMAVDITERRRSEEALREYAEGLRRSNDDLQRFAYVASHDLQEPLRSIVSFSQLLERRYRGQLGEDADEYIAFIVTGGQRMQGLILDLLAFSRVNTTRQQIAQTDTEDVLAEAVRSLDVSLCEADASITHDPLPVVMADPVQLLQVFTNLVSNAIKFRKPDVPLRIRIGAKPTDGFWEFSVSDNGIGIEPAYFDQIFVIFQRLHTKETYPGTGIGLAIVKRIIDRHGGRIWVESTQGEGSTFFFTLPAA